MRVSTYILMQEVNQNRITYIPQTLDPMERSIVQRHLWFLETDIGSSFELTGARASSWIR